MSELVIGTSRVKSGNSHLCVQLVNGRVEVECRFEVSGNQVSFRVRNYNKDAFACYRSYVDFSTLLPEAVPVIGDSLQHPAMTEVCMLEVSCLMAEDTPQPRVQYKLLSRVVELWEWILVSPDLVPAAMQGYSPLISVVTRTNGPIAYMLIHRVTW